MWSFSPAAETQRRWLKRILSHLFYTTLFSNDLCIYFLNKVSKSQLFRPCSIKGFSFFFFFFYDHVHQAPYSNFTGLWGCLSVCISHLCRVTVVYLWSMIYKYGNEEAPATTSSDNRVGLLLRKLPCSWKWDLELLT